jgi:FtsH-binding integral membrane protein
MAEKNTKTLEKGSIFEHLDTDGDGVITDAEMARAKEIAEFDHKRAMQANQDAKEDQIRKMAWFSLFGLLLYPIGIALTSGFGLDQASQLIADIAPTYFVAIAALVSAFFGADAYKSKKDE